MAGVADGGVENRRHRRDLQLYYGLENGESLEVPDTNETVLQQTNDPCNIDGSSFQQETYLFKLIQEKSLTELMDEEQKMMKDIRSLDSDMQTLVYENYNKFISATDTIRKMKNDFRKMEDEMDHLASNMSTITEFSANISTSLQDRRQQIMKLAGVHSLLKKLQFLFELPARLKKCIELDAYVQAVRYYTKALRVLHQYEHMPSFQGIHADCEAIIKELREKLMERFRLKESTAKQLTECVDLLLQLGEPAESLCDEFLSYAKHKLDEDLQELKRQIKLYQGELSPGQEDRPSQVFMTTGMDVLEFVDCGCNGFLSNICLVIASYNDMFLSRTHSDDSLDTIALRKLVLFVNELMEQYFNFVRQRVQLEKETGDNTILVRALDRFHRRLQAMNKLLPDTDFSRFTAQRYGKENPQCFEEAFNDAVTENNVVRVRGVIEEQAISLSQLNDGAGTEIVSKGAKDRVNHYMQSLKQHLADCLTDIRQSLVAPRLVGKQDNSTRLADLLNTMQTSIIDHIKSVLSNLQAFIAPDITFAMKPYFRGPFCSQNVREGLVVAFVKHVCGTFNDFCEVPGDKSSSPPALLMILSRFCINLENATISYLLSLTEEQFMVEDKTTVTATSELLTMARDTGQHLLNHYVRVQGLTISQMLRKSVETRDWLNTIEPRNVRAVMKRVVEDITAIDQQVGQLYEEGVRKERSSDSSRRTHAMSTAQSNKRPQWNYAPSVDNSLMSNIQKLFSEKIEVFSTVEFSKVSVLTGIVKISLKTFLECVRLRTFGRYGLQQIQVDTHYLQLYLWRFVSDENLVQVLLDEIVCSAVHRCLDPSMMEPSVIDLICERG